MDAAMKQRIEAVLASYGADPARWPASERARLLPHLEPADDALRDARLIDQLLDLAAAPSLAAGLEGRLISSITRRAAPARFSLRWSAALPLAASFALGIYLGAMGTLDDLLPSVVSDDAIVEDDDSDVSGVTEATDYSGEQLS